MVHPMPPPPTSTYGDGSMPAPPPPLAMTHELIDQGHIGMHTLGRNISRFVYGLFNCSSFGLSKYIQRIRDLIGGDFVD